MEDVNETGNSEQTVAKDKVAQLRPYQFQKGRSGNPNGRPKSLIGKALLKRLRENGDEQLKAVVEGILSAAQKGDAKAFSAIFDRIDGKPSQPLEHTGDVNLNVVLAERIAQARKAADES